MLFILRAFVVFGDQRFFSKKNFLRKINSLFKDMGLFLLYVVLFFVVVVEVEMNTYKITQKIDE